MELTRDELRGMVDDLPDVERRAVEAIFYEQVTYSELARRTGTDSKQAWRVTQRGLARLKLALLGDD